MTKSSPQSQAGSRWPRVPARVAALALAAAAGMGVAGAASISLEQDITALLPDTDDGPAGMVGLARDFGLMRRVAVAVGPGEPGADSLLEAADAVARAISVIDGVERVTWRADPEAARRAAELLMDKAFLLGGAEVSGLDRDAVARRLESLRERLASPESLVIGRHLLADPLGLAREALAALERAGRAMGARVERGRLVSAGGDWALVFVDLDFDPLDVGRATRFVEELDSAVADGLSQAEAAHLSPVVLGGPHFAAASGGAIIGDVRRTFVLTVAGVLAVFLIFFRRLRFLPVALLPGGAGVAVALGVFGLAGVPLHALTLGFAATITGISVDYAIHLLHRSWHAAGEDSGERMSAALAAVGRPMVLGCATTVAAFLLVATSAVPGMRQLALFSSISIPVALGVTLFVLPAFHPLILGRAKGVGGLAASLALRLAAVAGPGAGGGRGRRVALAGLFAAVTATGVILALGAPRSGDPRDLGYRDPELARREALLARVFPGLADQATLVASGDDPEQALAVNDAAWRGLPAFGIAAEQVVSIAPFLPSRETQSASAREAGDLLEGSPWIEDVFRRAGFTEGYLDELRGRTRAAPLVLDDLTGTALEGMAAEAVRPHEGRWYVLTRARAAGDDDLDALAALAGSIDGLELVSERLETRAALEAMLADLGRMLGLWLAVALVVLGALHRSWWFGVRSALPAVFGVAVAGGVFGLLGRPVTPVAGAGLTLVLGLGIDYGLFVNYALARRAGEVAPAVAASALTTLAAFGVLALADTRAMADLGLTILAGVSAAMLAALLLLPALEPGAGAREVKT